MAAADAGEHFPQSVEDAIDGDGSGRRVVVVHVLRKHLAFSGGMLTVGFDVDREILVIARRGYVVVLHEAFYLRFTNGGDLAFVGVESGESFGGGAFGANGAEGPDQVRRFVPFFGELDLFLRDSEGFGELEPKLGMVRGAGFFVDEVLQQLTARRLVVGTGMDGGEIGRESGDVMIILARVISERGPAQFAPGPGEIEGMSEKMFGCDLAVDGVEMIVHTNVTRVTKLKSYKVKSDQDQSVHHVVVTM